MSTPEYLRNRAMQAEVAGDTETANALNAEADELEKTSAPAAADPQ